MAKLIAVMVEAEAHRLGPFIARARSMAAARYFLARHAHLGTQHVPNLLGRFTTVWACPRVRLRVLGLIHGGMVRWVCHCVLREEK